MSTVQEEKLKKVNEIIEIGNAYQNYIKAKFAESDNFVSAVEETNNDQNNNLLLGIFAFFGSIISSLTKDYTEQIPTQKTLDELKEELQKELKLTMDIFNKDIMVAVDKLMNSTLAKIEASGFLTEIVTNPCYSGRLAKKEFKKL